MLAVLGGPYGPTSQLAASWNNGTSLQRKAVSLALLDQQSQGDRSKSEYRTLGRWNGVLLGRIDNSYPQMTEETRYRADMR